jgi:hypothetical protein
MAATCRTCLVIEVSNDWLGACWWRCRWWWGWLEVEYQRRHTNALAYQAATHAHPHTRHMTYIH